MLFVVITSLFMKTVFKRKIVSAIRTKSPTLVFKVIKRKDIPIYTMVAHIFKCTGYGLFSIFRAVGDIAWDILWITRISCETYREWYPKHVEYCPELLYGLLLLQNTLVMSWSEYRKLALFSLTRSGEFSLHEASSHSKKLLVSRITFCLQSFCNAKGGTDWPELAFFTQCVYSLIDLAEDDDW